MEQNKELNAHVKAIGEWASEDSNRVAFVVCGELTEDGVETSNALVGRSDKIATALFGNAMEDESEKQVLMLAAKMVENPLFATILCMEASKDEQPESKSGLADSLKDLFGATADKLRKND